MESFDCLEAEHRLCLHNHALFIGETMTGKTRLVLRLLQSPQCFKTPPEHVYFYYSEWQDIYDDLVTNMDALGISLHMRQGHNLKMEDVVKHEGQSIYVIDYAFEETASSDDIAKVSTNARQRNASLWLIWQMLYSKHPASRTISTQAHYHFFLPSARFTSQLKTLDTQMVLKGALVDAHKMAIHSRDSEDTEFKYLLVDTVPFCDERFKLRGRVHVADHQILYLVT